MKHSIKGEIKAYPLGNEKVNDWIITTKKSTVKQIKARGFVRATTKRLIPIRR